MMEAVARIKNLLDADGGVSDYRINTTKTESSELFFVHKSLETVRSTDTTDIKVTVFLAHDGKLGDVSFSVYPSYTDEDIKAEIEKAKKRAALIFNESYELPSGETGSFTVASNFEDYDASDLGSKIADAVFAADKYEGGSINALEIFIYKDVVNVVNSRGIDKTEVKYRAMVEAIPTWNGGEESVELYEAYNFTEFYYDTIVAEIDGKMREVRDRLAAVKPEEKLSCPVVLCAPEVATLVEELAYELNFSKIYNHSNAFSIGDEMQKNPTGDKLTVTMMGKMKGSVSSASFDGDGATLVDTKVIENGRATGSFGSVRFASYLGKEPTGDLRCVSVECGTVTDAALQSVPYFKCVSMSGLQLDIYSDYIGGEVRLAYYFDGEKEIPVTGISISGKLSEALSGMRLSADETVYEGYKGPKYAIFDSIEIV